MADSSPGFSALKETEESALFGSGPDSNHRKLLKRIKIKSTSTDSNNTPTTTLRGGQIIAMKTSDGLNYPYSAGANDGTQVAVGVLPKHVSMLDKDGSVEDKPTNVMAAGIIRNVSDLVGIDKESLATLLRSGFILGQSAPHGSAFGTHYVRRTFKTGAYTFVDGDHGALFVAATNAVAFTLPDLATVGRGFQVAVFNSVDANMSVIGATGTILWGGVTTTMTWSTASNKIGASAVFTADYLVDGTTLAWYPTQVQRTVTGS